MNTEKIAKVFSYIFSDATFVFVNMDWGAHVQGFKTGAADPESTQLTATSGDTIAFQSESLTDGTNREAQLRSIINHTQEVDERVNIGDCFPGKQVVIITGGDSLYGVVPVLNDRMELLDYIRFLRDYYQSLPEELQWSASRHLNEMECLAIWLYKNNPQEKTRSIVDELEEKLKN